jgi:hypothetical protein
MCSSRIEKAIFLAGIAPMPLFGFTPKLSLLNQPLEIRPGIYEYQVAL